MPGITAKMGSYFAEAAATHLTSAGHEPGCDLEVVGSPSVRYSLLWTVPDENAVYAWHDLDREATEAGAYGIALLLVRAEGYEATIPARQGTGFDYWLARDADGPPFSHDVRLEVSGIREGSPTMMRQRIREKQQQINRYSSTHPGIVIVVEFSGPRVAKENA